MLPCFVVSSPNRRLALTPGVGLNGASECFRVSSVFSLQSSRSNISFSVQQKKSSLVNFCIPVEGETEGLICCLSRGAMFPVGYQHCQQNKQTDPIWWHCEEWWLEQNRCLAMPSLAPVPHKLPHTHTNTHTHIYTCTQIYIHMLWLCTLTQSPLHLILHSLILNQPTTFNSLSISPVYLTDVSHIKITEGVH